MSLQRFSISSPTMYVLPTYFLQVQLAHEYRLPTASCLGEKNLLIVSAAKMASTAYEIDN